MVYEPKPKPTPVLTPGGNTVEMVSEPKPKPTPVLTPGGNTVKMVSKPKPKPTPVLTPGGNTVEMMSERQAKKMPTVAADADEALVTQGVSMANWKPNTESWQAPADFVPKPLDRAREAELRLEANLEHQRKLHEWTLKPVAENTHLEQPLPVGFSELFISEPSQRVAPSVADVKPTAGGNLITAIDAQPKVQAAKAAQSNADVSKPFPWWLVVAGAGAAGLVWWSMRR